MAGCGTLRVNCKLLGDEEKTLGHLLLLLNYSASRLGATKVSIDSRYGCSHRAKGGMKREEGRKESASVLQHRSIH
jgi:hypothetical protein